MKYTNKYYKKIKKAYILTISCAHCKEYVITYQKVGRSNLVKMYLDRIVDSAVDLDNIPGAISCPICQRQLATKYVIKRENKIAYRLVPSMFNKSSYNNK